LSDVMTTDEFLAHYGKKGMKWGVRTGLKDGNADVKRGEIKGIYRTPSSGKEQSRKARFAKRFVANAFTMGLGGVAYNSVSRPLKTDSAATIRNQTKLAYGAKTALSILGGPGGVIQYQQVARPIGPKGSLKKTTKTSSKTAGAKSPKQMTDTQIAAKAKRDLGGDFYKQYKP
jgi:hypothetical protein